MNNYNPDDWIHDQQLYDKAIAVSKSCLNINQSIVALNYLRFAVKQCRLKKYKEMIAEYTIRLILKMNEYKIRGN